MSSNTNDRDRDRSYQQQQPQTLGQSTTNQDQSTTNQSKNPLSILAATAARRAQGRNIANHDGAFGSFGLASKSSANSTNTTSFTNTTALSSLSPTTPPTTSTQSRTSAPTTLSSSHTPSVPSTTIPRALLGTTPTPVKSTPLSIQEIHQKKYQQVLAERAVQAEIHRIQLEKMQLQRQLQYEMQAVVRAAARAEKKRRKDAGESSSDSDYEDSDSGGMSSESEDDNYPIRDPDTGEYFRYDSRTGQIYQKPTKKYKKMDSIKHSVSTRTGKSTNVDAAARLNQNNAKNHTSVNNSSNAVVPVTHQIPVTLHHSGPWVFYSANEGSLGPDCGKWMYFFSNRERIGQLCQKAVAEGVCTQSKHNNSDTGVSCFYIHGHHIAAHKRVLTFFMDNHMISRTKAGKLKNISFKYDEQTLSGEYGGQFEAKMSLSDFLDLTTGEWIRD